MPTSVLHGASPFERIYKCFPKCDNLRVFGCLCFATKLNNTDKFAPRSENCIMLGYSNEKKGYKLLSIDTGFFLYSRDVKFYENVFPFKMKSSSFNHDPNSVLSQSDHPSWSDPFS